MDADSYARACAVAASAPPSCVVADARLLLRRHLSTDSCARAYAVAAPAPPSFAVICPRADADSCTPSRHVRQCFVGLLGVVSPASIRSAPPCFCLLQPRPDLLPGVVASLAIRLICSIVLLSSAAPARSAPAKFFWYHQAIFSDSVFIALQYVGQRYCCQYCA